MKSIVPRKYLAAALLTLCVLSGYAALRLAARPVGPGYANEISRHLSERALKPGNALPAPSAVGTLRKLAVSFSLSCGGKFTPGTLFETAPEQNALRLALLPGGGLKLSAGIYKQSAGKGLAEFEVPDGCPASGGVVSLYADDNSRLQLLVNGRQAAGGEYQFLHFPYGAPVLRAPAGVRLDNISFDSLTGNKLSGSATGLIMLKTLALVLCALSLFFAGLLLARGKYAWLACGAAVFLLLAGFCTDFSYKPIQSRDYYSDLADAFSHGQLSLLRPVPPELLAEPDPYAFDMAWKYKIWDYSLYNGKFYLYFGPVPALLRLVFFNAPATQTVNIAYAWLYALFFLLALRLVKNRLYPDADPAVLWLTAFIGAANPLIIHLAAIPSVYNSAVLAAAAFMAGAVYFYLRAVTGGSNRDWVLAGIFAALAAASRVTAGVAALPLLAHAVLHGMRTESSAARRAKAAVLFALPLCIAAGLLAWYNYARFGSIYEFGVTYQLNGPRKYVLDGTFFSISHILPNLRNYFFGLPRFSLSFPWISTGGFYTHIKDGAAFSVLLWYPLMFGLVYARLAGAAVIVLTVSAAAVLLFDAANVALMGRYIADFGPLLSLAGAMSLLAVSQNATRKKLLLVIVGLLAVVSAAVMFGMQTEALRINKPALHYAVFGDDYWTPPY